MSTKYPPLVQKIFDQHYRALYQALLASGFCTKCYREPQVPNKVLCESCLVKARVTAEKYNRAKGQKPWQPGKPGRPPMNRDSWHGATDTQSGAFSPNELNLGER